MGSVSSVEEKETFAFLATWKHSKKTFIICETRNQPSLETKRDDTLMLDMELPELLTSVCLSHSACLTRGSCQSWPRYLHGLAGAHHQAHLWLFNTSYGMARFSRHTNKQAWLFGEGQRKIRRFATDIWGSTSLICRQNDGSSQGSQTKRSCGGSVGWRKLLSLPDRLDYLSVLFGIRQAQAWVLCLVKLD